jgi:hypothetical protein
MIVVYREDNTPRLISQPAHAGGAGQLAECWQKPCDWPDAIWHRFVEAVHRHDDGWLALEDTPALDEAGRPYTFKNLPTEEHVSVWRRGIDQLAENDPYHGLVLALHAHWLYTQVARNDDPTGEAAAQQFLQWIDGRIDELMRQLSGAGPAEQQAVGPRRLEEARRLIGFFDMVSLVLLGALPMNDWPEPLPFGERTESLRLHLPQSQTLAVEPWPFATSQVTVNVPAYDVQQDTFESSQALGQRLRDCEPVTLQFCVQPPDKGRV